MTQSKTSHELLFELRASTVTVAGAERVYALVSDLPRSFEWSPECIGGRWVSGEPGQVGSVFRGDNHRSPDVVAWAPVVRGGWSTESEVVAAEPGRTFRWAMRDSTGRRQDSVWGFDMTRGPTGTVLTHHFRMGALTEGMKGIISGMTDDEQERFFVEWGTKVEGDLAVTVQRVREFLEA